MSLLKLSKRCAKEETRCTATRNTPRQHQCEFCKGKFFSPPGKKMCPHCGKYVNVKHGYLGSPAGFFTRYLEGIAQSEGVSVEVRNARQTQGKDIALKEDDSDAEE